MALGVPTEGPPSRPTTQQAMLAYLHDIRCIASSTRANPGPCPGAGNSHSFGKRSGQPFLKHVKNSSTDMILGKIVRRPQDCLKNQKSRLFMFSPLMKEMDNGVS
jgi:hypothetical protein